MSRCLHVYGGHLCPRPATKKVGVYVDGHEPGEWIKLCEPHAIEVGRTAFDTYQHERMVRVLTLDLDTDKVSYTASQVGDRSCAECGQTVLPGDECPECDTESDLLVHDRCCPENGYLMDTEREP